MEMIGYDSDSLPIQETTKIGFIGPYCPSDTTESIFSLADLTFRCGYSPILYSLDTKYKNLHPRWEKAKLLTGNKLISLATLVIWDSYLEHLQSVWTKIKHIPKILILDNGITTLPSDINYCFVKNPQHINLSLKNHFGKHLVFRSWSSGRILSERHIWTKESKLNRIAVYLPPDYLQNDTYFLPLLLEFLIKNNYQICVCGFVSKNLKKLLVDFYAAHKEQISLVFSPSYLERRAIAKYNDWVVVLNLRDPNISVIGEFLDYMVPVICVEHPQLLSQFEDNIFSINAIGYNNTKANPVFRVGHFIDQCFAFLNNHQAWFKLVDSLENQSEIRQRNFISAWSEIITSCMRSHYHIYRKSV